MSEGSSTPNVEVRRAWRYAGEDEGSLHIELAVGDKALNVHLKAARNPRMVEFITQNADVTTEERPAKAAKADE